MTQEQIREKLLKLHTEEKPMSHELSRLDFQIKLALKKKAKIAKMISANMKSRNYWINKLERKGETHFYYSL